MAKQTLLEMTQEILESMQSDIVTSINDTGESIAVARIIRRAYWDLFPILNAPEHYTMFQLTETSGSTPTRMTIPDNVYKLEWIEYQIAETGEDPNWKRIEFKPWDQFLQMQNLPPSLDYVDTYNFTLGASTAFYYLNDKQPNIYSTPDDENLFFNSLDTSIDTFLRATKTRCYGLVDTTFTLSDGFTPDLDSSQFPLLFNEAKAMAFAELKQTEHAKAERRLRGLKISAQRGKYRTGAPSALDQAPNFGKQSSGGYSRRGYYK